MISFIFVHLVSAQLNNERLHKHSQHALTLSQNSAIYIFTKLSKEPVAHYENDHSDGLENMRSLLIQNFERRKHPVTGFLDYCHYLSSVQHLTTVSKFRYKN